MPQAITWTTASKTAVLDFPILVVKPEKEENVSIVS